MVSLLALSQIKFLSLLFFDLGLLIELLTEAEFNIIETCTEWRVNNQVS